MATDLSHASAADAATHTRLVRASLRRRHLNERIFRSLGLLAICIALGFVALLFVDVFRKGVPAFTQTNLHVSVTFDPEVIDVGPAPLRGQFASEAEFRAANLKWQRDLALLNWNTIVERALRDAAPAGTEIDARAL